jgi:hypothetical protein
MASPDTVDTTIPSRLSFSSAGAARARPAEPARPTGIEAEFVNMPERMGRVPPRNFSPFLQPDGEDLEARADELRAHIRSFRDYVTALMKDCADASWHCETSRMLIDGLFEDLISETCCLLRVAADKARKGSTYRTA